MTQSRPLGAETLESRNLLTVNVVISEFLASNGGPQLDGDGDSSDWIELFNAENTEVDLGGYYLTDDALAPTKWQFPNGTTIASGSTLLVYASDKGTDGPTGELHTNYKLSSGGEYLGLIEPDGQTVVHDYAPDFPTQERDISYGLSIESIDLTLVDSSSPVSYVVPNDSSADATWNTIPFDDSGWLTGTAGVGYESSTGSSTSYAGLLGISPQLPSNTTSAYTRFEFDLAEPQLLNTLTLEMIYDDGFVAYLNGEQIASDNAPTNPVWNSAAGSASRGDSTVLADFVTFDISQHIDSLQVGTNVLAIHALNRTSSSDMLMIPQLTAAGMSRLAEPQIEGFFDPPTPNSPNGELFAGSVEDTKFSVDRGFYDAPILVEITTATPDAMIVYTTDGSEPEVGADMSILNGTLYRTPLTIASTTNLRAGAFKQGFRPTNIDTQTYIFTSDVITQTRQSALNSGLPTNWGSKSADYGFDPDVIGPNDRFGGQYVSLIEDGLKSIPSISLTLDSDDFFGSSGIYSNPNASGVTWERATSAELIFPDGEEGFQIDAGLRIHGGASRSLTKKNALRLLFKSEYGDTKLRYPLFGETGVEEFDTIVLRPHFNDGWGWGGAEDDPLFIRDQWFRDTQAAMGHASSRGNLMHLYVNGLYWGLYNPSERPDDSFAAEIQGGDKSEYDVVNHDGLHKGSISSYNTMIDITESLESARSDVAKNLEYQRLQGNLADGSNDPSGEAYLDVTNYIDYMILNHYGGNNDWPNRNWFSSRQQGLESEGFRFYAWDSEISLALSNRTSLTENNIGVSTGAAEAWGNLRSYDEFRLEFADRVHKHLFNGGALYVNPENPTYDPSQPEDNRPAARFAELAESVFEPLVAESARWGDQHVSTPRTRDIDWQNELTFMLRTYFRDRHEIVLDQWQSAGLYPTTNAPEFSVNQTPQHGGILDAGSMLEIEHGNRTGVIYFTTDGSDPRLTGGNVNTASAQVFSNEVQFTGERTHIKARVLRSGEWSALSEAVFTAPFNADFNSDGTVDAADFTVWRDNQGATGTDVQGDANHDLIVDDADWELWKSQFGTTQPLVASAAFNSVDIEIENGEALSRPAVFGDTNGDGVVSPVDALQIINALNADQTDPQSSQSLAAGDIDGDGEMTPLDALLVINQLNAQALAEFVDTADANDTSAQEDEKGADSVFASLSLDLEDDDDLFPFG